MNSNRLSSATILILLFISLCACQSSDNANTDSGLTKNESGMPLLVDLGASKCIPCQKMAPMLEQLSEDYHGEMEVKFIDVWKNKDQAAAYGIQMIPTQIFYAPDGTELFRHAGFYSREQIIQKWNELGYSFEDIK